MKYETPELVALAPALDAIQSPKQNNQVIDHSSDPLAAYEDWE